MPDPHDVLAETVESVNSCITHEADLSTCRGKLEAGIVRAMSFDGGETWRGWLSHLWVEVGNIRTLEDVRSVTYKLLHPPI